MAEREHHDHDAHAGHGHAGHDHAHDLRGASRRSLTIALALISTYMVAEIVGGIMSGSLALLADAGHMLIDAAAIVMALMAMWIAGRAALRRAHFRVSPHRDIGGSVKHLRPVAYRRLDSLRSLPSYFQGRR